MKCILFFGHAIGDKVRVVVKTGESDKDDVLVGAGEGGQGTCGALLL